ncbi:AAA family ATPase [Flavihumibacter sp. CACIAM 22H1]|uniref:AAA family ATPase n=1 Tax=Flavihumibacter sp. CACIAM 22H1 TaxID=1812911 RepID=UPI0007A91BAB|nr:AAA family ATPase [Flavihumibacter sp. CACIAM 22H1]KYP14466.1 MAG: hypothetical protein A1D16_18120 [Flavihumibacter sp. CACIAM 22H1]
MKKGLVLGKFYPLHIGHIALINFAALHCDELTVLICASDLESIAGTLRKAWLDETFSNHPAIQPVLLTYKEAELPNSSVSSREIAAVWANKIRTVFPDIGVIISSEPYGAYLAEQLNCTYHLFDIERKQVPVSSTLIRNNPLRYWDYIAVAARPFFCKKICLSGTESTGKSTLAQALAEQYNTCYVPEMAREIIQETEQCRPEQLPEIARLHAATILKCLPSANRFMFVDTDLRITQSYSKFLFGKELLVEDWILEANQFDCHLYLNKDAPYIQDGTRLDVDRRNALDRFHRQELNRQQIPFFELSGNWQDRFDRALHYINHRWVY